MDEKSKQILIIIAIAIIAYFLIKGSKAGGVASTTATVSAAAPLSDLV